MQYEKHVLPNGLRVILAPMKEAETVTVLITTATGSRYETKKEGGLSHFLEHMFFKGTKRRPTALSISEELDGVGGEYNAFTSKDRTAYYAKVDRKHAEMALDIGPDAPLARVKSLLADGESDGRWDYEEGCITDEWNDLP